MKFFLALLTLTIAYYSHGQTSCSPVSISTDAANLKSIQHSLTQIHIDQMDSVVPFEVSKKITEIKDAFASFTDATLACSQPNVDPSELQKTFASTLSANSPLSSEVDAESNGSYGHNLRVSITSPKARNY